MSPKPPMPPIDDQRRKFCQLSGLVIVGAPLLSIGCGEPPMKTDMAFCGIGSPGAGLNIADIALNTATKVSVQTQNIFICRDDKGIYAVEARCPHQTTEIEFVSAQAGFKCPIPPGHGATFDFNGLKHTAPSPGPLPHYLVCATPSGSIVVDVGQVVEASTRYRV